MKYVVYGLGLSGNACISLLTHLGKESSYIEDSSNNLPDDSPNQKISIEQLLEIGPKDIEEIIISPGINVNSNKLRSLKSAGFSIVGEAEFALRHLDGVFIGVTGTNGKSTCVKMLEFLLIKMGYRAIACGNIGYPVSQAAIEHPQSDFYIIELSSYQLESFKDAKVAYSIFYNFGIDHLERHGCLRNYLQSKLKLLHSTSVFSLVSQNVINLANDLKLPVPTHLKTTTETNLNELAAASSLKGPMLINGIHAASMAASILKLDFNETFKNLEHFKGLKHRFEIVTTINNKKIINDSKATNIESTLAALRGIEQTCVLLLGGESKGDDFSKIQTLHNKIERVIAFGAARLEIEEHLSQYFKIEKHPHLETAVSRAFETMIELESDLLFSPACSSFDEFKNFEHRGEYFVAAITKKIEDGKSKN